MKFRSLPSSLQCKSLHLRRLSACSLLDLPSTLLQAAKPSFRSCPSRGQYWRRAVQSSRRLWGPWWKLDPPSYSHQGEKYIWIPLIKTDDCASSHLKLSIPEQLHTQFSIYPSEAGALALGGALSDRRLFSHCRESGDPSGSLKFFVSTSPDRRVPVDPSLVS